MTDTDKRSQRDRFIETARAFGCNEDEDAFKAKLAVIARQKPKEGRSEPPVTVLPARRAKGALSVADWATSRSGMRDKAQRTSENKRQATKQITKPTAPGTKR